MSVPVNLSQDLTMAVVLTVPALGIANNGRESSAPILAAVGAQLSCLVFSALSALMVLCTACSVG